MNNNHAYQLIGVGLGVFNLSLATLLDENGYHDALFFEKQANLNWHGGMLLDSSELQVHYLKDLVTPVDPTSKYTFLNYLKERGLLYQFINRKSESISRNQFNSYFRWVAQQLSSIRFNSLVSAIDFDGELFSITVNGEVYRAHHIAIASGLDPFIPECVRPHLGSKVFHVADYARHRDNFGAGLITVIGGGQSGAEVAMDILENSKETDLQWFSRQVWFGQLEDNCFVNELYIPSFTRTFRQVSLTKKQDFIDRLAMSSDGINQNLLDRIYRLLFERRFFSDQEHRSHILAGQELIGLRAVGEQFEVTMKSWADDTTWLAMTDKIVLATGFRPSTWRMLHTVLDTKEEQAVGTSFEVQWSHQETNHIFLQNGSRMSIGLADANLSIAAWRSAMIANSLLGKDRYAVHPDTPMIGHLLKGNIE